MAANTTVTFFGKSPPEYIDKSPKSQKKEIIGLGFPLGIDKQKRGFFSKKTGIDLIKNSVKQLFLTERGERVMLPNFGCSLKKYLFQPLDEVVFENIREEIKFTFNNYISGADIVKLAVFPTGEVGPSGGNSLKIILTLRLKSDYLEIFEVEVNIK